MINAITFLRLSLHPQKLFVKSLGGSKYLVYLVVFSLIHPFLQKMLPDLAARK